MVHTPVSRSTSAKGTPACVDVGKVMFSDQMARRARVSVQLPPQKGSSGHGAQGLWGT